MSLPLVEELLADHAGPGLRVFQVEVGIAVEPFPIADVTHIANVRLPAFAVKVFFKGCWYTGDNFFELSLCFVVGREFRNRNRAVPANQDAVGEGIVMFAAVAPSRWLDWGMAP